MESIIALLGITVVLFVSTNVDDLFVLLGFFSNPKFRYAHVAIGQYVGMLVLFGASVLASFLSVVIPPKWIGLLGLAPIFIGAAQLRSLWKRPDPVTDGTERLATGSARAGRNIAAVAATTIANGGDNVGVYTPLFATRPAWQIAVAGLSFAIMTGLWCAFGHWLVHHPALGAPIRRYGPRTLPFVLIVFGIAILYEAGTLHLQ